MAGVWIARRTRVKDGTTVYTADWLAETSPAKLRAALAANEAMHGTVKCEKHILRLKGKPLLLAALSRDLRALSAGVAERVTYDVSGEGARALRGSHEKLLATRRKKKDKKKDKKEPVKAAGKTAEKQEKAVKKDKK